MTGLYQIVDIPPCTTSRESSGWIIVDTGLYEIVDCTRYWIVLDTLLYMDKRIRNYFVSLIMNGVKEQEYSDVSDDDVNLFKPVLFELFGNVQELVVSGSAYAFNLERLSQQYALPKSLRRMTIWGKWLKDAFTDSVQQNMEGWEVEFFKDQNGHPQLTLMR